MISVRMYVLEVLETRQKQVCVREGTRCGKSEHFLAFSASGEFKF